MLKDYTVNLSLIEQQEKRKTLRLNFSIPTNIILLEKKTNQQVSCLNISTEGICIEASYHDNKFFDLILDNKFTARGKVCWKKKSHDEKNLYYYGLSLDLDEPDKFKRFIKNNLLEQGQKL